MKFTAPLRKHKKNRFSPEIGTYSRQSEDFKSSIKVEVKYTKENNRNFP